MPYKEVIYNWDFLPEKVISITGENATIYADIPFIYEILGYQNRLNLKAFNHRRVNDLENFMNKYKPAETFSLLDYTKQMDKDSYLLISYYKLSAARDYQEFHKKYKLVSLCRGKYLYKLD